MIQKIHDWFRGTSPLFGGVSRSSQWPTFKKEFEKNNPKKCMVCGNKKCDLHHFKVFHLHPELELDLNNVGWFCQGLGTGNHHLWIAHLGSFRSWNEMAKENAKEWKFKIENRP